MFVDEHRDRFGVEFICETIEVSPSAYYERRAGRRSARSIEDERLLELTHERNYSAYGYRRTCRALLRAGELVPRCTVQRLMRAAGIQGAKRRGKPWRTTTPDPDGSRSPDLVERDFSAEGPNRLWVADITYLRSWEGVSFLAFVIDVFSRKLVGWQLASHMRTTLVLDALRMALGTRGHGADVDLVHHSDRGSNTRRSTSPRSSPTTASWPRSDRSATPTTTRWPNRSSTASRPSSPLIGCSAPARSSSSPSSSGSPGSTTTACTSRSATSRRASSRPSTRLDRADYAA